jgi:PKD repeat protein
MNIKWAKKVFFLAILNLLVLVAGAQTITVGSVDAGPYGQGSTISVPIKLDNGSGCFTTNNKFDLYLSDANGNFSVQQKIGTTDGFYATFVNGVIPNGTPAGSGYLVKVVSTAPVITSTTLASPFTISSSGGIVASVSSQILDPNYPEVFGACYGTNNKSYTFLNQSTSGAIVTASFYNDLAQTAESSSVAVSPSAIFIAKAANYTVTVKATKGGIVSTRSYVLINNVLNNSFGNTGSPVVCLKGGGDLTYNIDVTSPTGIQKNYPGIIYSVNWGDGAKSTFTICDIIALGGKITHNYTSSSCGSFVGKQRNVFGVDFQSESIYCGTLATTTGYAKVLAPPENKFAEVPAACINTPVTFTNTSYPGQSANSPSSDCVNPDVKYSWYVDDVLIVQNYGATQAFVHTFNSAGKHIVKLVLQNADGLCGAADITSEICIQKPPKVVFTLPKTAGCLPLTAPVIPENNSVIDNNCNASNAYLWITAGPALVIYADGTNENSEKPHFVFTKAGVYRVNLIINTASCGQVLGTEQTITVDEKTVAQLSNDVSVCGINQTLKFNTDPGITHTVLTGIGELKSDSYTWTVTGGAFEFTGGTTANSQYPQILFKDATTYTVKIVVKNDCGTPAEATQQLKFQESPTISAGDPFIICAGTNATVTGVVKSGTITGQHWTGGTGRFVDANQLVTTYIPSPADIAAGTVTLVLTGNTTLPIPCDKVVSTVVLTIEPQTTITSTPTLPVCSGTAFNYQITASKPNSVFTWTIDPARTSTLVSGYDALPHTGAVINQTLTNSDTQNPAVVTYIIKTTGSNCNGTDFTLTVTVAPKQIVASFTQDITEDCGPVTVQFTNTSIPLTSTFTWSFGDGSSSTEINPKHTFAPSPDGKDITYPVTLQLYNACGDKQTIPVDILVRPAAPVARIVPQQLSGCSPLTLTVDNQSPGTNKSYTFYVYDGSTLVDKSLPFTDKRSYTVTLNPTVAKRYNVYMVAEGFCGITGESFHFDITVSPPTFKALMQIQGDHRGCYPFTATFFNGSSGGDKFVYKIYDKNGNFVEQVDAGQPGTPQPYTYPGSGTFYASIHAASSCATDTSDKQQNVVQVDPLPIPAFSADVTSGCKSLLVKFTNSTQAPDGNSQASAYSYDWDFGDGSPHVFVQNPAAHLYKFGNSPYTVTLVVTNTVTQCTATIAKNGFITVNSPPFTAFTVKPDTVTSIPNYRFSFVDQTTGGATSWKWNLGDGQSSTSQNPEHTYRDTGVYTVTLTTFKGGCDSTISHRVHITGIPGQLYLPNAFMPTSGTTEIQKFIAKGSGIKKWHLQIFNNYGQLIWETSKLSDPKGTPVDNDGWDGTFKGAPVQQGVYIWQASATFINGTEWKGMSYNNSLPKRTGTINLIR